MWTRSIQRGIISVWFWLTKVSTIFYPLIHIHFSVYHFGDDMELYPFFLDSCSQPPFLPFTLVPSSFVSYFLSIHPHLDILPPVVPDARCALGHGWSGRQNPVGGQAPNRGCVQKTTVTMSKKGKKGKRNLGSHNPQPFVLCLFILGTFLHQVTQCFQHFSLACAVTGQRYKRIVSHLTWPDPVSACHPHAKTFLVSIFHPISSTYHGLAYLLFFYDTMWFVNPFHISDWTADSSQAISFISTLCSAESFNIPPLHSWLTPYPFHILISPIKSLLTNHPQTPVATSSNQKSYFTARHPRSRPPLKLHSSSSINNNNCKHSNNSSRYRALQHNILSIMSPSQLRQLRQLSAFAFLVSS